MSAISTHVLDTSQGQPAAAVAVELHWRTPTAEWELVAKATTNADGRVPNMPLQHSMPQQQSESGEPVAHVYRLSFDVAEYFVGRGQQCFFPEVKLIFEVADPSRHTHVPLLLSPFGYTTYRGS